MPNCDERPETVDGPDVIGAIELRNVRWSDGSARPLGPIDLDIDAGERVTITGDGASMLTRFIAGTAEPTVGTVRIAGVPPTSEEAEAAVSAMVDPLGLADELTLRQHLGAAAATAPGENWHADADDLVERFGIAERLDERLFTFSRGMRQKASICMAFVREFDILILDEPFGGLDVAGRARLLDLLATAHHLGSTVIIATDDPVTRLASDRVVVLRDGAIVGNGPPEPISGPHDIGT